MEAIQRLPGEDRNCSDLVEAIELLLQARANVNDRVKDELGTFPLLEICSNKASFAVVIARRLIDAGANLNLRERVNFCGQMQSVGISPLGVALWARNKEMIKLLVSRGADVHRPNLDGSYMTPLIQSRYNGCLRELLTDPKGSAKQLRITLKPVLLKLKKDNYWTVAHSEDDCTTTGQQFQPDIVVQYRLEDPAKESGKGSKPAVPYKSGEVIREAKCGQDYVVTPTIDVPLSEDGLCCLVDVQVVVKHGEMERLGNNKFGEAEKSCEMGWSGRSLDFLPKKLQIPLRSSDYEDGTPAYGWHWDDVFLKHESGYVEPTPDQTFAIDMTVEILEGDGRSVS